MLNRRNLRIKAMQTLFAYQQCRKSNQEIAWQDLCLAYFGEEAYSASPDFFEETEEREDPEPVTEPKVIAKERIEEERLLKDALEQSLKKPDNLPKTDFDQYLKPVIAAYQQRLKSDRKHLRTRMLKEVEGLNDLFKWILSLFLALRDHEQHSMSKKQISEPQDKLYLAEIQPLDILEQRLQGIEVPTWKNHSDRVAQWLKEIKQHDQVSDQLDQASQSWEHQIKFLRFLFKSVLWKSETFQNFFEEHDMGWNENKDIIKSLVNKTLKSIDEEGVDLAPISYQWEEDSQFFEEVFDHTLDHEETTDALIAQQAKNWDSDRIAQLDMVILKMALSEMIKFPSIPVKVTINEYIELSKRYSTPKSKGFINGILDVLSAELTANGTIKKSGRGLIDNK